MPFSNKSELKTALGAWLHRASISTKADDCITLAESSLNRELGEVLTQQTLTGTLSSRSIDISGYSVAEPVGLFLVPTGGNEVEIYRRQDGTFPYSSTASFPSLYAIAGDNLNFNCPLDSAYSFRFKFRQRFGLVNDGDTNWLLENHPDVYLAACIVWGALFTDDDGKTGKWASVLENGLVQVKGYISRQNNGELQVDPGLLMGCGSVFDITYGQ